jgi:uncharacterized protein (DUF2252 family)
VILELKQEAPSVVAEASGNGGALATAADGNDGNDGKSGLQTEISNFAFSYAAQVKLDWQSFVGAYQAGTPLY